MNALLEVIHSLNKEESRFFKLYAGRTNSRGERKDLKLFNAFKRSATPDEDKIAAKLYECPVVCVTGLYKLSPLYPHDQDTFNVQLSPSGILPFEDADTADKVNVANPRFDYIPPELVNLYVKTILSTISLKAGWIHLMYNSLLSCRQVVCAYLTMASS